MPSGPTLKERLFDVYAANLSALGQLYQDFPVPPGHFLCPFCQRSFPRTSLADPNALTIEHSIPGVLGGTLETATLTCKGCNNRAGTLFDAHLANRFAAEEFLQGISANAQRIWFNVGEGRARAEMKIERGERPALSVYFLEHHSNPRLFGEAVRALKEGAGHSLRMQFQGKFSYRPLNARIALLRIAFLMMFRHFGYGYALSLGADRVRQQILNPETELLPDAAAIDLGGEEGHEHCNTVAIITHPPEHKAFLVPLRLATEARTLYKGVIMPGPDDEEAAVYGRLFQHRQAGGRFRGRYTTLEYDLSLLTDPEWVLLPQRLWADGEESEVAGGDK
jgi:hypothetical protein